MSGALRQFTAHQRDTGLLSLPWEAFYLADDLALSDGDPVPQWDDLSGNGRHLSRAVTSQQPTFRAASAALNSQPAVVFDGSDDSLASPMFTTAQPTEMAAAMVIPTATNKVFVDNRSGGVTVRQFFGSNAGNSNLRLYASSTSITGTVVGGGVRHYWRARFDGASSFLRRDEVEVITGDPGAGSTDGLTLGADAGLARQSAIAVGFFGLLGRQLTVQEAADLAGWVQDKYDTP